jgi:hypothetical protein
MVPLQTGIEACDLPTMLGRNHGSVKHFVALFEASTTHGIQQRSISCTGFAQEKMFDSSTIPVLLCAQLSCKDRCSMNIPD